MYPLLELGPLRLSTGGLLLLIAGLIWSMRLPDSAWTIGGIRWVDKAERCVTPMLVGAVLGARLLYGLLNWPIYSRDLWLFVALRVADFAWPGAVIGAAIALFFAAKRAKAAYAPLADAAVFALPAALALSAVGALLSGEGLGQPTDLPWGIAMLGSIRHPTQAYDLLAALIMWAVLVQTAPRLPIPGAIAALGAWLHGLALLLIEALRADSLLLFDLRFNQIFGLLLMLMALWWAQGRMRAG
ncbi:MAG: hypothetical protein Fur005_44330 [Roseiflexaceae bacterium]